MFVVVVWKSRFYRFLTVNHWNRWIRWIFCFCCCCWSEQDSTSVLMLIHDFVAMVSHCRTRSTRMRLGLKFWKPYHKHVWSACSKCKVYMLDMYRMSSGGCMQRPHWKASCWKCTSFRGKVPSTREVNESSGCCVWQYECLWVHIYVCVCVS